MKRPNLRRTAEGRIVVSESDAFSGTCPACGQTYLKATISELTAALEAMVSRADHAFDDELNRLTLIQARVVLAKVSNRDSQSSPVKGGTQ